ncbi:MAG: hypothetical protein KGI08_09500, partial [Thaumarchaeota archaeon]|nr:hypothetical protein [Nitrososphaerota archaeon]
TFNQPTSPYKQEPKPVPSKREINFDILDEDTKNSIRRKAEEKYLEKEKVAAEDAFLEKELERLEREAHPEIAEEERDITIDLPLFADRITIDNNIYFNGRIYTVKKSTYDVLMEIMQRAKRHEIEVTTGGDYYQYYMKERAKHSLSFKTGAATHNGVTVNNKLIGF